MKLQYASDLHLEFPHNKEFLKVNPLLPKGDILLLAGDIVPFAVMDKHADFFKYVSDNFQATYWIPGNHEYYYSDAAERSGTILEKIKSNVFLVNNTSVIHDNVKLIFTTLWSKISPAYQWQIERGMSDFHVIKHKGFRFSATLYNQLHEECLNFLKHKLNGEKVTKSVVVTHHVPTMLNYPERYKGDALNEAFAVELYDLILADGPDFWIYGHTHNNKPDFEIGKTQMSTNQMGYVKYGEHFSFKRDQILRN